MGIETFWEKEDLKETFNPPGEFTLMVLKTLGPDPNLHWLVVGELMLKDVAKAPVLRGVDA